MLCHNNLLLDDIQRADEVRSVCEWRYFSYVGFIADSRHEMRMVVTSDSQIWAEFNYIAAHKLHIEFLVGASSD